MSTGTVRRESTQNEGLVTSSLTRETAQEQREKGAAPRILGMGKTLATNTTFYLVTSMSEPGRVHVVLRLVGRLQCDCVAAARWSKVCAHRRVVHDYLVAETQARMPDTTIVTPAAAAAPDARDTAILRRSQRPFSFMK